MSLTFTKLFSSITESTVWCEDHGTRIVWITMLAMADKHGRIFGSVPGLANRARVSLAECQFALGKFCAVDEFSRTKAFDGRRIEEIDGGWRLLNYEKYREIRDQEDRREYKAAKQKAYRDVDRRGQNVDTNVHAWTKSSTVDTRGHNAEAEADADAEADAEAKEKKEAVCPEMVSRAVLVECALAGRELDVVLTQVAAAEMKAGADPEALVKQMCASWGEYQRNKPNLSYAPGAEKFFGQGLWKSKDLWPWREGQRPVLDDTRRRKTAQMRYEAQQLKEEEEYRARILAERQAVQ